MLFDRVWSLRRLGSLTFPVLPTGIFPSSFRVGLGLGDQTYEGTCPSSSF